MAETKLQRDLAILTAMADEMGEYLDSDVLFWPMRTSGMPKLTIGGYLMRQFRLLALGDSLDAVGQKQLSDAVSIFNRALIERVVRFEKKATRELDSRMRQWGEFLRDLERDRDVSPSAYGTAVEARAMVSAIVEKLQKRPYQLPLRTMARVDLLDANLRRFWEPGQFVWPEEWQPAYPQTDFWWLYGLPKD